MFVDRVTIDVQAGNGGNGCASFRREKYVPRGGPDGGDGGNGGSVIIVAEEGVDSLAALAHRKRWAAKNGGQGQGSNRHGRSAEDLIIRVPPGTVVQDEQGQFVLKDLAAAGQSVVAATAGKGGKGNVRFKSSTNRSPRQFTDGGRGEARRITLELKTIADVGLIGKPNAGKSTLLSRLSHARPEIADYPFTTKHPNLGRVQIDFDHSLVMADIPGLIEGAHEGVGLGHEFLRHVERAGILVHLVEPCPTDGSDPLENYRVIRDELAQHSAELAQRPEIVVVTKAELPGADEVREQLEVACSNGACDDGHFDDGSLDGGAQDIGVLAISAVTGQGLDRLIGAVSRLLAARGADTS